LTARLSVSLRAVGVRRCDKWVLRDISLRLEPGEQWALIGGNGAGKTQLLKLLSTDVWPTPTGREARIYSLGRRHVDLIAAKRRIAYVGAELQDKYSRYGWNLAVRDLLATGLHRTDLLLQPTTPAQRRRIASMLERCGLGALAARGFLSLSYGQKRIALLARALVQNPDWLLLDEFYNGLDDNYRRRVDGILAIARAQGQSWIAAAHRAADVPNGTQGLMELHAGRLLTVKRLCSADLDRLVASAEDAAPRRSAGRVHRRARKTVKAGVRERAGNRLIQLTAADLYVDYRPVLLDMNWQLRSGQHWAVFGANGSGKSSFLKLLYGDLSPALGGRIERRGLPRGTPIEAWKLQVGFVSPELQTDYAVNVSVFDLVASGRYASIGLSDAPTAADKRSALRLLRFFSLLTVAKRQPRELSYGQLRRALIARALVANARILLLDEPLTGLDPPQRAAMKRLFERLMRQLTLVMAVHHPEDLPRGMTHALHLHKRRIEAVDLHSAT
jgi:molybdate transport system ATP-binding protein